MSTSLGVFHTAYGHFCPAGVRSRDAMPLARLVPATLVPGCTVHGSELSSDSDGIPLGTIPSPRGLVMNWDDSNRDLELPPVLAILLLISGEGTVRGASCALHYSARPAYKYHVDWT